MKQIIADHAIAIGSSFMFEANDGIEQTEMQMYQLGNGGLIAIDEAFLEANDGDDLFIQSPWDDGKSIQLIDSMKEKVNTLTSGEENDPELIDSTLDKIKEDISNGDLTALAELLQFLPEECLKNYIG